MSVEDLQNGQYREAVSYAEGKRQQAMIAVEQAFTRARRKICEEWSLGVNATRAAWEAVKDSPDHPEHAACKDAFDRLQLRGGPNYQPAYDQRAEQVAEIDRTYQRDVAALRARHGVTTVPVRA